jgi:hypothetical protein
VFKRLPLETLSRIYRILKQRAALGSFRKLAQQRNTSALGRQKIGWIALSCDLCQVVTQSRLPGGTGHDYSACGVMRALRVFRSRGDGVGRVVRNSGGEVLNYNAHWFVPAVRAAGIKNFRWHDTRHCYASRLRQAGVPLGNIAELLGHRGLAMTRRYAHLSISNLHDAVSRISTDTTTSTSPRGEISGTAEYVN